MNLGRTGMLGWALVATLAAGWTPTQAQPERPMGHPMERMERLKKVRMIEMLGLTEDQSSRFFARLNEHDTRRRELMKSKGESLDKIERLVRNRADEKEIEKAFADVADAESKFSEENQRFFTGLKELLTVEQRAKFLLFERQFERELREALRDITRRRFRPNEE